MDKNMFDRLMSHYYNGTVASVRKYSGRGMYGDQCVGVVVESLARGLWDLGAEFGDELPAPSIDNMGTDYILYWPNWKWDESYEEQIDYGYDED